MNELSARRWQRIEAILDKALELGPAERVAFVAEACGDDDALRSEVEALLHADEDSHAVLDSSLGGFATALLQPSAEESPGELPMTAATRSPKTTARRRHQSPHPCTTASVGSTSPN